MDFQVLWDKAAYKDRYYLPMAKRSVNTVFFSSGGTHWIILGDEYNTRKKTLTNCIEEACLLAYDALSSKYRDELKLTVDEMNKIEFIYCDSQLEWHLVSFKKPYQAKQMNQVTHIEFTDTKWQSLSQDFWKVFEVLVTG